VSYAALITTQSAPEQEKQRTCHSFDRVQVRLVLYKRFDTASVIAGGGSNSGKLGIEKGTYTNGGVTDEDG
jgi:hypothetical protein